jgi:hypothetical protein
MTSSEITSEMRLSFDAFLVVIANDCIENDCCKEVYPPIEFTKEQNKKYKRLCPKNLFWGGYAYLDEMADADEVTGFIRLYSPQGSGKWCFRKKGDEVEVWFA